MQSVVLVAPGLGLYPVKPVDKTIYQSNAKAAAVETLGAKLIVTSLFVREWQKPMRYYVSMICNS